MYAFRAAPRGRACLFVLVIFVAGLGGGDDGADDAGPVDGGTQLVLCGKQPFRKATDFLGLKAFACDGSACLEEQRTFHFVCRKEEDGI